MVLFKQTHNLVGVWKVSLILLIQYNLICSCISITTKCELGDKKGLSLLCAHRGLCRFKSHLANLASNPNDVIIFLC